MSQLFKVFSLSTIILVVSSSVFAQSLNINYFKSDLTQIVKGDKAVLSWSVSGADSVTIYRIISGKESLLGEYNAAGAKVVRPANSVTFRLVAANGSSVVEASIYIEVVSSLPNANYTLCASHYQDCILPDYRTYEVLFGASTTSQFNNRIFSSKKVVRCGTSDVGGVDPAPGQPKSCWYRPIQLPKGSVPAIDIAKIPDGHPGYDVARVIPERVTPSPASSGAWRTHCEFSHMNFDDPIVFPGKANATHLHMFFGNKLANYKSTTDSISSTGASTCDGGILNRTAYWAPAIIDTTSNEPIAPSSNVRGRSVIWYYKSAGAVPAIVQAFPAGLKMIAGHPHASIPQYSVLYTCRRASGLNQDYNHIPKDCLKGDELFVQIKFPRCWDGINLDSPDHRSHMAYDSKGSCPSSHPVVVPEVGLQIRFAVHTVDTSAWRLSSDAYSTDLPGGYSFHADWMNGWDKSTIDLWIKQIINKSLDGGVNNLGNGTMLD